MILLLSLRCSFVRRFVLKPFFWQFSTCKKVATERFKAHNIRSLVDFIFLLHICFHFWISSKFTRFFFQAGYFRLPNESHFNFNHGRLIFFRKEIWQWFMCSFEHISLANGISWNTFLFMSDKINTEKKIINWNCLFNDFQFNFSISNISLVEKIKSCYENCSRLMWVATKTIRQNGTREPHKISLVLDWEFI